ncbi:MAG: peptidylprolyl isomerase [Kiritimatiellae bacterium]|nr:peptidylprolyl isomerase [Kiritimatiellia bacterium]
MFFGACYSLSRDAAIVYLCIMRFFQLMLLVTGLAASAVTLRAGTLAQFITPLGIILVELFDQDKPVTVNNFIRLTEAGAYQNSFIHRADPGFVIQGGGFTLSSNLVVGYVPNFGTVSNEYAVGTIYSNVFGTIAMAKVDGDPDSATSQWFFNLADNPYLNTANGGFTVFGRIIKGEEILRFFNNTSQYSIWTYNDGKGLVIPDIPYLSFAPHFVMTQINILNPEIRMPSADELCIDWITAAGMTNILERTPSLTEPDWQPVMSFCPDTAQVTTYTGSLKEVSAIYRVRVPVSP